MMIPDAEQAVTAEEIAVMLKVTAVTVRRQAQSGDIPGFKVGRVWRFYPSKVREALTPKPASWSQSRRSLARKRVA
jgi:excisionase family DNA binding protein